jgi:uncharacterized membrane protein
MTTLKYVLLAALVLLGLDAVVAGPAHADAAFCNKSAYPIQIAYRSREGTPSQNQVFTVGWMQIESSKCERIYAGNAALFPHDIAMLVKGPDRPFFVYLRGVQPFLYCVTDEKFFYHGALSTCPAGYYKVPFFRFATDSYDATFWISDKPLPGGSDASQPDTQARWTK